MPKTKKANIDAFLNRSDALNSKASKLIDILREAALEEGYAALETALTAENNEHSVYITGDGIGIALALDLGMRFTVINRTWEDIFMGYQNDLATAHPDDVLETLQLAEAGVAAVTEQLKQFRAKYEAKYPQTKKLKGKP